MDQVTKLLEELALLDLRQLGYRLRPYDDPGIGALERYIQEVTGFRVQVDCVVGVWDIWVVEVRQAVPLPAVCCRWCQKKQQEAPQGV